MAETAAFESALDARVAEVLERCTKCGACVEACPMPGPAGLDVGDPKAVAGGVIDLLRGGAGTPEAARWAAICSGSGSCIPACRDGVNPRFMLAMARLALLRRPTSAGASAAPASCRCRAACVCCRACS